MSDSREQLQALVERFRELQRYYWPGDEVPANDMDDVPKWCNVGQAYRDAADYLEALLAAQPCAKCGGEIDVNGHCVFCRASATPPAQGTLRFTCGCVSHLCEQHQKEMTDPPVKGGEL